MEVDKKVKIIKQLHFGLIHQTSKWLLCLPPVKGLGALGYLLQKTLPTPSKCFYRLKSNWGFDIDINPSIDPGGIEERLYRTGVYEYGVLKVLQNWLKPGDFVIDAGANIGWLSLHMAVLAGNEGVVYAYEPHPALFSLLQDNIKRNHHLNIRAFQLALGDKQEKAVLYDNAHINRGGASLIDSSEGNQPCHTIQVNTLDMLLADFPKNPDLLKIDVEGMELAVLKGALQILRGSNKPRLIIEISEERPSIAGKEEFFEFLKNKGYAIFSLSHGKERCGKLIPVEKANDLPIHDNIFCAPLN